jgi:hypothetical protein
MPLRRGRDSKGSFYRWGHQKKYYYFPSDPDSRKSAKRKAIKQGVTIGKMMSGYSVSNIPKY